VTCVIGGPGRSPRGSGFITRYKPRRASPLRSRPTPKRTRLPVPTQSSPQTETPSSPTPLGFAVKDAIALAGRMFDRLHGGIERTHSLPPLLPSATVVTVETDTNATPSADAIMAASNNLFMFTSRTDLAISLKSNDKSARLSTRRPNLHCLGDATGRDNAAARFEHYLLSCHERVNPVNISRRPQGPS